MRRYTSFWLAAAIAAGLPAMAMAQEHHDHGGGGGGHPEMHGGGPHPEGGHDHGPPPGRPQNFGGRPGGERPAEARPMQGFAGRPDRPVERPQEVRGFDAGHPGEQHHWAERRPEPGPGGPGRPDGFRGDGRPGGFRPEEVRRGPEHRGGGPEIGRGGPRPDDHRWVGSNWRADRRYDWRGWRDSNRGAFHVGRYMPPPAWRYGYRRWGVGGILPNFFWAQNYWLADPWEYRLPPAYGPYRWIRYYDDVLLIDLRTGRIVDVIPDFFW